MSLHAFIILATLSIAAAVLWSDPRRVANQAFGLIALICAIWVFHIWALVELESISPVPILRSIAIFVPLLPWTVWWAGKCVAQRESRWRTAFVAGWPWLAAALSLAAIAQTEWFIPDAATRERQLRGPGYVAYHIAFVGICLALLVTGYLQSRELVGSNRRNVQFIVIGGASACLLGIGITALFRLFDWPHLAFVSPVLVLSFFIIVTAAIITRHGAETRYRHLSVLRRATLLILVSSGSLVTISKGRMQMPVDMVTVAVLVLGTIAVLLLDGRLRSAQSWLVGREDEVAAAALQKLNGELQGQPDLRPLTDLAERIVGILDCNRAAIFWRKDKLGAFARLSIHPVSNTAPDMIAAHSTLVTESVSHHEAWLLPGSHPEDSAWLADYRVCVPVFESGVIRVLILLGESERTLGYSFAEMSALQSLGVTINHSLSMRELHARQAEQEQLALAGKLAAGIAHNIRNPLAVVRACLEADPALPDGAAQELHAAAAVKVRSIQSTVDSLSALARGERFALERHDLALLIRAVLVDQADYLAQCGARAKFAEPEGVFWGLAEPHQLGIALTNLVRNAAEEIAKDPAGGVISITLDGPCSGRLTIRVADTGRGLPQHIVEAVFTRDLFAKTTKRKGRSARRTGYGIGLHSTMLIITTGHDGKFEYRDGAFQLSVLAAE